jgi:type IV pilus assembly protein PilC
MISAGEDTGKLDTVLEHVSGYYDREVENAIKAATSLIEPIMMTAMGIVVGGIALALMLPIFTLSKGAG